MRRRQYPLAHVWLLTLVLCVGALFFSAAVRMMQAPFVYFDHRTGECVRAEDWHGRPLSCNALPVRYFGITI